MQCLKSVDKIDDLLLEHFVIPVAITPLAIVQEAHARRAVQSRTAALTTKHVSCVKLLRQVGAAGGCVKCSMAQAGAARAGWCRRVR